MPNQKISELTAVTSPVSGDALPIVNAGSTKKIAVGDLTGVRKNYSLNNLFTLDSTQAGPGGFGCNNVFLGQKIGNNLAGTDCSVSKTNTIIGNFALSGASCAIYNIAIGQNAMRDAINITNNGGYVAPTMYQNIVLGHNSGMFLTSCRRFEYDRCGNRDYYFAAKQNIIIGGGAGNGRFAQRNIFIGSLAGSASGYTNINCQVESGMFASDNVFLGHYAGKCQKRGRYNTFIGNNAGSLINYNCNNTFVGHNAARLTRIGSSSTVVGADSVCQSVDRMFCSTIIGSCSLNHFCNSCIDSMIAIGTRTGRDTLSGSFDNIFIGNNIAAGYNSSTGTRGFSGQRNTIIGHYAGCKLGCYSAIAVSNDNIFLGFKSGTGNRGCRNVFIGTYSNHSPTSYSVNSTFINNSIVIGFSAQPLASNTLVLGSAIAPLSTVATAGAAAGFLVVNINGTHRKIAFNNF
jgi:hypothetical protein